MPDELLQILRAIKDKKVKCGLRDQTGFMDYFSKIRNICMVYLMYYTGLRPQECYDAKLEFFDVVRGTFFIPASSNRMRFSDTIDLPFFVIDVLKKYLSIRKKAFPDSSWLFPAQSSRGRLSCSHFSNIFRDASRDCNFLKLMCFDKKGRAQYNTFLYCLRVSYASIVYYQTGGDIPLTDRLLRHRDKSHSTLWHYVQILHQLQAKFYIQKIIFPVQLVNGAHKKHFRSEKLRC